MKTQELKTIISNMMNGNTSDAVELIAKGCKTDRAKFAGRVLDVYKELLAMRHTGQAQRLHIILNAGFKG